MHPVMPLLIFTAVISGTIVPTVTVVGPIQQPIGAVAIEWTPGPAEYSLDPAMPDFNANMNMVISIALAWVRHTWLDGQVLDYWMLYQVAVWFFGQFLGYLLGAGGFSIRERVAIHQPAAQTEEK